MRRWRQVEEREMSRGDLRRGGDGGGPPRLALAPLPHCRPLPAVAVRLIWGIGGPTGKAATLDAGEWCSGGGSERGAASRTVAVARGEGGS